MMVPGLWPASQGIKLGKVSAKGLTFGSNSGIIRFKEKKPKTTGKEVATSNDSSVAETAKSCNHVTASTGRKPPTCR
jgi:hypothetical protein